MTLTKQEAIENHRKMWNWIADELEKGNGPKYYNVINIKTEYFIKHNIKPENTPKSYCYCCEYAKSIKPSLDCGDCPLKWPNTDDSNCLQQFLADGLYIKIRRLFIKKGYKKAAKLARKIANLPEREDV
jgi:hypothetical protein